jgi:Xaa-Pro aminopeptidase
MLFMSEAYRKQSPEARPNNVTAHEKRRGKLRELLFQKETDAVLVSNHSNVDYFTGFKGLVPEDRESYLLVTRTSTHLFTSEMYSGQAERRLKQEQVVDSSHLSDKLKEISERENLSNVGIEENNLTVGEYKVIKKVWDEKAIKDFSVDEVREIKDEHEVEQLREVSYATDEAFGLVLPRIKAGVSELELREELEDCIKEVGYEVGFKAIVAFGANAGEPHHLTDETRLEDNSFVLFDFGLKGKEGYLSDMSRTIFFGSPTEEQVRQYETVREAQQMVTSRLHEVHITGGTMSAREADAVARDYIVEAGYPSIPHALGHGIGLDVHEDPTLTPRLDTPLVKGMVFTNEPGIYLSDGGVRIEDVLAITDTGVEVFNRAPKELIVIPTTSAK